MKYTDWKQDLPEDNVRCVLNDLRIVAMNVILLYLWSVLAPFSSVRCVCMHGGQI